MEVNKETNIFTLDANERNRELEGDFTERNLIESTYWLHVDWSSITISWTREGVFEALRTQIKS